jgi:2',3'-cyclic-nucleotide 2'-phosphodiesterase (5'-nucleotidase family)
LTGIDAVGLGPSDLALGWTDLHRILTAHELPVVADNLTCDGAKPFPASKVVTRGGVTVGFVGAYVGTLPPEAATCTVEDPQLSTASAVSALQQVDVVVALGAWDAKQAEALVTAIPAIDFVVSAANLTLPDGRALGQDDWLLAAGSRGKKVGLLKGTLVPKASGWQSASPGASQADQLDSYRKRLASNKERLASATDDKAKQRAERQIAFYEKEIARIETELSAATATRAQPAHRFENALESMSTKVADHAATAEIVAKVNAELKARGLVVPEEPHPQRVDLAPDGLPLDLPMRQMGPVPIQLRGERLRAGDLPVPEPPGKGAGTQAEQAPAKKE